MGRSVNNPNECNWSLGRESLVAGKKTFFSYSSGDGVYGL
jgi:hypothetical protein